MKELVFLDTSFLFAYHNEKSSNNKKAVDFIRDFAVNKYNWTLVISDYIFDELLTLMISRVGKTKAIEVCKKLTNEIESGIIRLIKVDDITFKEAIELFINHHDKEWSFTDCTSHILIRNNHIVKAVAFDRHFRQFSIEILPLENS
jgi:predicted nucleic acid-binding protein